MSNQLTLRSEQMGYVLNSVVGVARGDNWSNNLRRNPYGVRYAGDRANIMLS